MLWESLSIEWIECWPGLNEIDIFSTMLIGRNLGLIKICSEMQIYPSSLVIVGDATFSNI